MSSPPQNIIYFLETIRVIPDRENLAAWTSARFFKTSLLRMAEARRLELHALMEKHGLEVSLADGETETRVGRSLACGYATQSAYLSLPAGRYHLKSEEIKIKQAQYVAYTSKEVREAPTQTFLADEDMRYYSILSRCTSIAPSTPKFLPYG